MEQPAQHQPPGRHNNPSETHGTIRVPEDFELAHDPSVGEDPVHDAQEFFVGRAIAGGIEVGRGDILKSQMSVAIPALEPVYFTAAGRVRQSHRCGSL